MKCSQIDRMLDDLMDGALTREAEAALEAHAAECPSCAAKLAATRKLMAMLSELAPEIDVPLEAQAKWRGAVKNEARAKKRMRFYRYAGGIAAALVVAVGAAFALKPAPAANAPAAENAVMDFQAAGLAVIEADGADELEAAAADTAQSMAYAAAPMREVRMTVADLDAACGYLTDLVKEYEGELDEQRFEDGGAACANLYIRLPNGGAAEFLSAASGYDVGGGLDAGSDFNDSGAASLMLVLRTE